MESLVLFVFLLHQNSFEIAPETLCGRFLFALKIINYVDAADW